MKSVLFSPIGITDPIRGGFDGPMLHIVRHYQPDTVLFFLTSEMAAVESAYGWNEKMAKAIVPGIHVENILTGIEDASSFSACFSAYESYLSEISKHYPNTRVLLNISSGTPQMIAALCVLASSMPSHMLPIQVKTPEKRANSNVTHDKPTDDISSLLENLFDHDPGCHTINRCVEISLSSYVKNDLKQKIFLLIERGSYQTAFELADANKGYFNSPMLTTALRGAAYRRQFSPKEALCCFHRSRLPILLPVTQDPYMSLFEYFLFMRESLKSGDYSRYLLCLTVYHFQMLKFFLTEWYDFDIGTLSIAGTDKPDLDKIQTLHPEIASVLKNLFNSNGTEYWKTHILERILKLFQAQTPKPSIKAWMESLTDNERKFRELRNMIAHQLASVTKADFERNSKQKTDVYLAEQDRLFIEIMHGTPIKKHMLDSYNEMNKKLRQYVEQS